MPFEPYNPTEQQGFIPYNPEQTKEEGFVPYEPEESLTVRGLKGFINLVPETIKETAYGIGGGKLLTTAAAYKLNKTLKDRGITPPPMRELQQRLKQGMLGKMGETIPEFEIAPATTVGEKIVDVAAGIAKFTAKLAILRKAMPGVSDKALWEIENTSSGGIPGLGALTHSVFSLPGKFFPGKTAAGKAGQLVAEVGAVGGFSALQQKITTGEISWEDVAISAGIPVGLRSLGYVKSKIAAKDPVVVKAAIEVQKKASVSLVEGQTPVKVIQGAVARGYVVEEAKSKIDYPRTIVKSGVSKASFVYDKENNNVLFEHAYVNPEQRGKGLGRGLIEATVAEIQKRYPTATIGGAVIHEGAGKVIESLGFKKQKSGFHELAPKVKPVETIDSVNKRLLETTSIAKELNANEVAAAQKVLRKRQAWRGTKATLAGMRAGRGLGESISAGRRAYGGKAKVPDITPPDLTPEQWNTYYKKIIEFYPPEGRMGTKTQFQRTGTKEALDKLKAGVIPTNYDFGLLDKILGRETTLQLHKNMSQHRKFDLWDIPIEVRDGLKSMFGYDPQVIRQARGIALRHPIIYAKGIIANVLGYASQRQANRIQTKLETSPGWELSKKQGINYLGVTPWSSEKAGTKLQQYGVFTDFLLSRKSIKLKAWGKVLASSERGADVGINTGLKKLWDVGQKALAAYQTRNPMTPRQIEKWNTNRVHDINAVMKRVVAKNPKARDIQKAANWMLFSSAHTISRPILAWRSIKNLATGQGVSGRTYAAQLTISNIASLSAISSIFAYIGHKARINDPTKEPNIDSSNDPTDSLWGKGRIGNDVIDFSGGDVGTYRLLARIGVSAWMYGKGAYRGKEYTAPNVGEELLRYIQSRETVLLGLVKTLATGKDWLGQPIGRKEAILKQFPMEFLVSVVEAGNADGMWEAIQGGDISKASKDFVKNIPVGVAGLSGLGTASYKVTSSSTRFDYQDIIAQKKYNKKWEDLTPIQQKVLKIQNKKQFKAFEQKVAEERVDKPYDPTRIIEEQRKAGIRMVGKLDKVNRSKVKGIDLGISRSPEKFRLNDERYNQYQAFIAAYLNKFLSRIDIKGTERSKSENVRIGIFVELAKRRALIDLKRSMR